MNGCTDWMGRIREVVWHVASKALLAALVVIVVVIGCGGGGGGGATGLSPTLTIDWPTRTRDVNAPSSAVSVVVGFSGGATATINRGAAPDGTLTTAYAQTYSVPVSIQPGTYTVTLQFYSLEDGAGGVVGTAAGSATISSTSLSLGVFTTTGAVTSVGVLGGQTVPVGSTIELNAAAFNSQSADLVVTPGSLRWSVVSTDGTMTLLPDGHVSATAAGTMTVQATVDNVLSPPQTITSYLAAPVQGCTNTTYSPNFVSEMETSSDPNYQGTLRHWTSFPVTVAIANTTYLNSDFTAIAHQALLNWTNATAGQVTFTLVSANANPDIVITFEPSTVIEKLTTSPDGVVGLTFVYKSSSNDAILTHADIYVATDLGNDNSTLNCATHELGHGLGISGHSNVAQNLMYPYLNDSFSPSDGDTNTLYTAYCGSFPQGSGLSRATRPPRDPKPIVSIDTNKK